MTRGEASHSLSWRRCARPLSARDGNIRFDRPGSLPSQSSRPESSKLTSVFKWVTVLGSALSMPFNQAPRSSLLTHLLLIRFSAPLTTWAEISLDP